MARSHTLTSEAAVRAAVTAQAASAVGEHWGAGRWSPYGQWYGWPTAYYCAAGWSWSWNLALGESFAHALIDHQRLGGAAPHGRGYIWTVALYDQHRARHTQLRNLRPGDALMYKYPTVGDRNTAVVNHADMVERNYPSRGYVDCIGFNVENPSAPPGSDQSLGGGVWRRRTYYSNRYVVTGIRFPAGDLAAANRVAWSKVQRAAQDLGLGTFQMTGAYGPATEAAVDAYAAAYSYTGDRTDPYALHAHMEDTMTTLDDLLREVRAIRAEQRKTTPKTIVDALMSRVLYGLPFHWWVRRGGILDPGHRHFPADPGSPAHKELLAEAAESGRATVYGPDGAAVLLELDEHGRFQIKED